MKRFLVIGLAAAGCAMAILLAGCKTFWSYRDAYGHIHLVRDRYRSFNAYNENGTLKAGEITFGYIPAQQRADGNRYNWDYMDDGIQSVYVVGDFTEWNFSDMKYSMKKGDDGIWKVVIRMGPGKYFFKYVVNSQTISTMSEIEGRFFPAATAYHVDAFEWDMAVITVE